MQVGFQGYRAPERKEVRTKQINVEAKSKGHSLRGISEHVGDQQNPRRLCKVFMQEIQDSGGPKTAASMTMEHT
jgi:hypothetical protein